MYVLQTGARKKPLSGFSFFYSSSPPSLYVFVSFDQLPCCNNSDSNNKSGGGGGARAHATWTPGRTVSTDEGWWQNEGAMTRDDARMKLTKQQAHTYVIGNEIIQFYTSN